LCKCNIEGVEEELMLGVEVWYGSDDVLASEFEMVDLEFLHESE
jgi:hypothetical protein